GSEGISLALQTQPDLIILDLNMKGLSGLDTLKALRAEGIDARILILTVSDLKSDIFTLIDAGADGYLLKDTEPDAL
ncbi:response regulator, partial [Pseudomonas aeruginosa]